MMPGKALLLPLLGWVLLLCGCSPERSIHEAAMRDDTREIQRFLAEGTDVDKRDFRGRTPLRYAARCGSINAVRLLIANGADVNARDSDGITPLTGAGFGGHLDTVIALADHGADLTGKYDKGRRTPLYVVNSPAVLRYLISKGLDVNAVDAYGLTPLDEAARANAVKRATLLVDHGALVNCGEGKGPTPLHQAAQAGSLAVAKLMLTKGAHVSATDGSGRTPLHYVAVGTGSVRIAALLLSKGANASAKDEDGATPLSLAEKTKKKAFAAFLQRYSH